MPAVASLHVGELSSDPLEAAAAFYAHVVPGIRDDFRELNDLVLVVVFEPAGHEHRAWQLAAIQELARAAAPGRVNGLVGSDEDVIRKAIDYLWEAPGVTGQLLTLDGESAGAVL